MCATCENDGDTATKICNGPDSRGAAVGVRKRAMTAHAGREDAKKLAVSHLDMTSTMDGRHTVSV
jgi:hypothetical protein